MAIYEYKKPSETAVEPTIALKEIPIYGGSRLGQYRTSYSIIEVEGELKSVKDKSTALGQRVYEFSNHLQNVLVVIADFKVPHFVVDPVTQVKTFTGEGFKSSVVSANDYYPFGMVMQGRKYYDPNYDYRYGFNGKEDDKDFGDKQLIQDYGFRLYNPAIARFLSVDPLAPSFPWYTPYQFAGNKPIRCIDLDGLEDQSVVEDEGDDEALVDDILQTAEKVWSSIVLITTGVAMPVVNQGYVQYKTAGKNGHGYYALDWAVPYTYVDGEYVPQSQLMSETLSLEQGSYIKDELFTIFNELGAVKETELLNQVWTGSLFEGGANFGGGKNEPIPISLKGDFINPIFSDLNEEDQRLASFIINNGVYNASISMYLDANQDLQDVHNLSPAAARYITITIGREVALINENGTYFVAVGTYNEFTYAQGKGIQLIYHTHPQGTPYPSNFDINWIKKNGDYNAENQKSIILPIGKQAIEFDKNTIYKQ